MQSPLVLPEDDIGHEAEDRDQPHDEDPGGGLQWVAVLAQDSRDHPEDGEYVGNH